LLIAARSVAENRIRVTFPAALPTTNTNASSAPMTIPATIAVTRPAAAVESLATPNVRARGNATAATVSPA